LIPAGSRGGPRRLQDQLDILEGKMAKQPTKTPAKTTEQRAPAPRRRRGDLFSEMQDRMNRMFEDVWRTYPAPRFAGVGELSPNVDVEEKDKSYAITAELPGMDEADIDVTLSDDVLTISGEKKAETTRDENNMHVTERSYGSFRRSFRLPPEADGSKIKASFDKGVLHVDVPKAPARENPVKKIEIKKAK
jgi:HSP20 family protein